MISPLQLTSDHADRRREPQIIQTHETGHKRSKQLFSFWRYCYFHILAILFSRRSSLWYILISFRWITPKNSMDSPLHCLYNYCCFFYENSIPIAAPQGNCLRPSYWSFRVRDNVCKNVFWNNWYIVDCLAPFLSYKKKTPDVFVIKHRGQVPKRKWNPVKKADRHRQYGRLPCLFRWTEQTFVISKDAIDNTCSDAVRRQD